MTSAERHPTRPTPKWFDEPSLGQRFLGSVIDGFVLAPLQLAYLAWSGTAVVLTIGALHALYEIVLVARSGQTVGKVVMGTRVVDSVDGALIDVKRAAARWFGLNGFSFVILAFGGATPFAGIYLFVVCVMVLRPPLHEGLHDRLAGTLVTRATRH